MGMGRAHAEIIGAGETGKTPAWTVSVFQPSVELPMNRRKIWPEFLGCAMVPKHPIVLNK
jgi:hypothetical protein